MPIRYSYTLRQYPTVVPLGTSEDHRMEAHLNRIAGTGKTFQAINHDWVKFMEETHAASLDLNRLEPRLTEDIGVTRVAAQVAHSKVKSEPYFDMDDPVERFEEALHRFQKANTPEDREAAMVRWRELRYADQHLQAEVLNAQREVLERLIPGGMVVVRPEMATKVGTTEVTFKDRLRGWLSGCNNILAKWNERMFFLVCLYAFIKLTF
ncbi:hypothetical protein HOT36_gp23 [Ralstonia phage RPSC1]|uniref:Uncharacterized protein n=1 Tax=Ralstonia phage RPSC1 TaxID=2041351 RepID=A0A2Z2U7W9_9CAUD|nr:hypothetical protein HOT36_gp23 [Ralstonia phage RPSC1]ATN92953.1 hypothetical protein RPSC1_22 [Ralstonia phage RPSC1]